jgi:hypothetical protein
MLFPLLNEHISALFYQNPVGRLRFQVSNLRMYVNFFPLREEALNPDLSLENLISGPDHIK